MSAAEYNRCVVCGRRYRMTVYPPRAALFDREDAHDMCPDCVDVLLAVDADYMEDDEDDEEDE